MTAPTGFSSSPANGCAAIKYIQNKEVEFDSDELDQQTLKLKDVRSLYTTHRVFTRFDWWLPAYGPIVVSNEVVTVNRSSR